jgi:hypothetical protein
MNHLAALLNVMESIELDKELGIQIFKNYITEYLQLIHEDKAPFSEKDFEIMKEVAMSLGLNPEEFENIFNVADEEDASYDKYDAQVDNVVKDLPPGSTEFTSYLNRWVSPNSPDANYLF